MMNIIVHKDGAYHCGPPAMGELRMSGRFVSYHALKSGQHEFMLPKRASKVIYRETGNVLANNISDYRFDGKERTTNCHFIE